MSDQQVSNFDVIKAMCEENQDIRLAPMDNISKINFYAKKGTEITIGFPGNLCFDLEAGKLGGGMFLWNLEQFKATKKRLEQSMAAVQQANEDDVKAAEEKQ